jgi:hypothetical protein
MIIRIATEGQFRVKSAHLDTLSEIDEKIIEAVANEREEEYQVLFNQMIELVRNEGETLDPDELVESTIVLPPPDTSFEEARKLFVGDGVIPTDL